MGAKKRVKKKGKRRIPARVRKEMLAAEMASQKRRRQQRKRREVARRFERQGGLGAPRKAPYVSGSPTSKEAAESFSEAELARLERKVYDAIRRARVSGATDDQIEIKTGMRHQSASARRRGLVLKGWVKDSGMVRQNRSGRMAIVWIVGREEFALPGAQGARRPKRPTSEEMKNAVGVIHSLALVSQDVAKLLKWVSYLARG